MSGQELSPAWLDWIEPEVVDLTDEQLAEFVAYWHERRERYRRRRRRVDEHHPNAYRWGYSAWWCSKYESIGLRESERRRIRHGKEEE